MGSGVTRWWEGYLVRYLMPSIAGVIIVLWLGTIAGNDFRQILLLPQRLSELNGPHFILLLLYGNLFCYVASYPVLTFHTTRVVDFSNGRWPASWWYDGYIWTIALGVASFLIALAAGNWIAYYLAYTLVALFSFGQSLRLFRELRRRMVFRGLQEPTSPLYGYLYALARRRSLVEEVETTPEAIGTSPEPQRTRTIRWRQQFIETYRHMREHGNSAYIFFLELSLAALVYAVLAKPEKSGLVQLSAIGVLMAIWAIPAVLVHLVGQHLERRFSQYDRRLS